MCTVEEREKILQKPILKYSDVMTILGCGAYAAYRYIESIRVMMKEQGKALPCQVKRVTSAAFRKYFEL